MGGKKAVRNASQTHVKALTAEPLRRLEIPLLWWDGWLRAPHSISLTPRAGCCSKWKAAGVDQVSGHHCDTLQLPAHPNTSLSSADYKGEGLQRNWLRCPVISSSQGLITSEIRGAEPRKCWVQPQLIHPWGIPLWVALVERGWKTKPRVKGVICVSQDLQLMLQVPWAGWHGNNLGCSSRMHVRRWNPTCEAGGGLGHCVWRKTESV